jgi:hypothetical protein
MVSRVFTYRTVRLYRSSFGLGRWGWDWRAHPGQKFNNQSPWRRGWSRQNAWSNIISLENPQPQVEFHVSEEDKNLEIACSDL